MKNVTFKMFNAFYRKMVVKHSRGGIDSTKALLITANTFVKAGYDPVQVSARVVWQLEWHTSFSQTTQETILQRWWREYRFIESGQPLPFAGWQVV